MTDHAELLKRHRGRWSGKREHGLTLGDVNTLVELQATTIRELTEKLEAERKSHDDLKRSILDGSHPNLVLERKARKEAEARLAAVEPTKPPKGE